MQNLSSKEIVEQPINLFLVSETSDVIEVVEKALAAISKFDTLTFTALNNGMPNLVLIVEIIKVKIEGKLIKYKDIQDYTNIITLKLFF